MNTPKLNSILSSVTGTVDPSRIGRAADPAHGLDFSRLLGEMRSQPATTAAPQRSSQNSGGQVQARVNDTPERQAAPRRESSVSGNEPSQATNSGAGKAAPSQPADTGQQSTAVSPDTQAANGTPAETKPSADASTDNASTQNTVEAPEQTGAQLAQAAAEAGVAAPLAQAQMPQQANVALAVSGELLPTRETAAPQPSALAQDTKALVSGQALVGASSPEAEPEPALATAQRPASDPSAHKQPVHAAALALNQAAALPAGNAASNPATAQADAKDLTALSTGKALPLPVNVETPDTAAARSLQDFTAMVAAARATSGTVLPMQAVAATHAAPAFSPLSGIGMPGLVPAGLFPGQAPLGAAPGAGIAAPLSSPQWPTEFSRQFVNIAQAANGLGQVAELRLDPPDLGPLRITINLNDGVAQAVISSPHALVRQTVESALPQLQQMLEQAGISLGQADVNDQHQPGQASQQAAGKSNTLGGSGPETTTEGLTGPGTEHLARPADPNALVDTFA